jgi:thiamine biosynthesis lipoprotein
VIRICALALALGAVLGCTTTRLRGDGRYAMGTVLEITLPEGRITELEPLFRRAADLERIFSRFDPASELSRLNHDAGHGSRLVSPELARLLADSVDYSRLTRGSFDVTIGPLVALWASAAKRGRVPSRRELAEARALVGTRHLRADPLGSRAELLHPGVSVDLGGVAKGFALDDLGERLRRRGVKSALLSFGQSSVLALGSPPEGPRWRLLLRDAGDGVAGIVELRDASLSVSGSLAQEIEIQGVKYGHLIDPRTGRPLRRRGVAAVTARSGARAEALSKAMLILAPSEGLALLETLPDAEGLLIDADGSRRMTTGWRAATRFREPATPRVQEPAYSMR